MISFNMYILVPMKLSEFESNRYMGGCTFSFYERSNSEHGIENIQQMLVMV